LLPKILVDSNVILDVFTNDITWGAWSQKILDQYCLLNKLCINHIIYTEISIGFNLIEELHAAISLCNLDFIDIPTEALFLAGKAFINYRKNKGTKNATLPDFFIGAHASVLNIPIITRDPSRMQFYFPKLKFISPS
jgi:predicted nucleic acid-binding protein